MKKIVFFAALLLCCCLTGCKREINVKTFQIQSLDKDRVILVDNANYATIISKSGQVLKHIDLNYSSVLPMEYEFKDVEIHDWGKNDAFSVKLKFIDDKIYFTVTSPSGNLHELDEIRVRDKKNEIALITLCSYCNFTSVYNSTEKILEGSVDASLSIWENIIGGHISYRAVGREHR